MRLSVLRVAAVALALNFTVAAAIALDQNLPAYQPVASFRVISNRSAQTRSATR